MTTATKTLLSSAVALALAAYLNLSLVGRSMSRPFDVAYVPDGATARWAALGHRTLLSDLYWLTTVQYIGESKAEERGFEKLLPLADLVTDLDPRHGYAYQTAGIVLSAAGRIEESNKILMKALEKAPARWSFAFYLAFNHWFYLGDYATGAHYAALAAKTPGASPNISHLAVSLSSKSGKPDDAIRLLSELKGSVSDAAIAARLDEQMRLAILERDAQALESAVGQFVERTGRDPVALEELMIAGLIAAIPEDPFGGRYEWKPHDRKVRSSANPFRFQLREAPATPSFKYQPGESASELHGSER